MSSYFKQAEQDLFNSMIMKDDTISCWIATRLNGASESLACEGNISIPFLKLLDDKIMPYVEKAKRSPHEEGMEKVATTPIPEGQKFPIGTRVKIAEDLGPYMSHFTGKGCLATVQYTYAHAYGGNNVTDYSLNIDGRGSSAWYPEDKLTEVKHD